VCQVKLKFFFFFFFCSHHEETSGQKRTEQVNFMVIINFMVSLKNIEERTEPENVKKNTKNNHNTSGKWGFLPEKKGGGDHIVYPFPTRCPSKFLHILCGFKLV